MRRFPPCCLRIPLSPEISKTPTMMRMVMAGSGMQGAFLGMQPPPKEEGVTYLCVTDVRIPDRKIGKPLGQPMSGQEAGVPKVQQMRPVCSNSFTLIAALNAPRRL